MYDEITSTVQPTVDLQGGAAPAWVGGAVTIRSVTTTCPISGKNLDEPMVMFGDIAVPTGLQNADPCTARSCLWPKARDGNVYVPYRIASQYCKWNQGC